MVRTLERAALFLRRDLTLGTVLDRLEKVHGNRRLVAEADDGLTLTYPQAAKRVRRWAGGIAERTAPGDVVVIAGPNGYEKVLLCCAASRAGAIPAPANDQLSKAELAHIVKDSGATLVLHGAAQVDGPRALIDAVRADPGDVAALFYTSGTTGSSKGAALTHRSLVGQVAMAAAWPARLHRDEAVIALPMAHIMGFAVVMGLAFAGIPVHLLPKFNPLKVLDAIESRRATVFVGVPAMYRMLDEAGAESRDLTSVRVWGSGADAMPSDLAERFKKMGASVTVPLLGALGQATFAEAYGMVEVGGGVAAKVSLPFLAPGSGPFGEALGFALPGYEMRVVDELDRSLPTGQVGELQVRGPGVLKEYWGDDDATAAVLDDDGWLRTGDLARKGPLGSLVFEGRAKHVIKRGGYSVYALEVEQALEAHPDVLEAAVVGVPDERLGEVPAAVVRLRDGAVLDDLALDGWAAERLSSYKVPVRFVAVDDLPRTGTSKVRKQALQRLLA